MDGRPVVAVRLHGIAYDDDLAVQAFARHLDSMGGAGPSIVAGMRAFLEHKPHLAPPPPWSPSAGSPSPGPPSPGPPSPGPPSPATGHRAVELLAAAAGRTPAQIDDARRASRHDLAGNAWILDPADGLVELVELLTGRADLVLVADPDDPATGPVLDALELTGRFAVLPAAALEQALAGRPALMIDTAWTPDLAATNAAGPATALVDRFGSGEGTPDMRAADLAGLRPGIAAWLDRHAPAHGFAAEGES